MEINESLLKSDSGESNILFREIDFKDPTTSFVSSNDSGNLSHSKNSSAQRPPYTTKTTEKPAEEETATASGDSLQKQYGFTSGHQNNFGVPIEDDERVLKILNDELTRLHNGTTTPRVSTTTGNGYHTKVSPTLPLIKKTTDEPTTERSSSKSVNEKCVSTSLPLCRGVLHYDLTVSQNGSQGMTEEETALFKYLLDSRCSSRAAQFMCSLFEPECRPVAMSETLPPCKRFCKCKWYYYLNREAASHHHR